MRDVGAAEQASRRRLASGPMRASVLSPARVIHDGRVTQSLSVVITVRT